jgi:hypothetical protein
MSKADGYLDMDVVAREQACELLNEVIPHGCWDYDTTRRLMYLRSVLDPNVWCNECKAWVFPPTHEPHEKKSKDGGQHG